MRKGKAAKKAKNKLLNRFRKVLKNKRSSEEAKLQAKVFIQKNNKKKGLWKLLCDFRSCRIGGSGFFI